MEQQRSTIEVFCCYAHEDEHLLDELKKHLSPLRRQQLIDVWHDRDISAGTRWEQEIERHLNEAHIILLLISSDFIHSDYCYGTEMKRALERHERGEARVIPVLLRSVSGWGKVPPGDIQLGELQALPKNAKSVTSWENPDEAWKDVAKGIKRVVDELLRESSANQLIRHQGSQDSKAIQSPDPQVSLGDIEVASQPTTPDKSLAVQVPQKKHISQKKVIFQSSLIFLIIIFALFLINRNSHILPPVGTHKNNSVTTLEPSTPSRVTTSSTYIPRPGNLLIDGSFEQGTKSWTCTDGLDIQGHHEGTKSWIQANIPKIDGHQNICGQDVFIKPQMGNTYTASILVRATRPTIIPIRGLIALWMVDEKTSGRDVNKTKDFITNSLQWTPVTVKFSVPNPWYTRMEFAIGVDNSSGVSLDMTAAQLIQDP